MLPYDHEYLTANHNFKPMDSPHPHHVQGPLSGSQYIPSGAPGQPYGPSDVQQSHRRDADREHRELLKRQRALQQSVYADGQPAPYPHGHARRGRSLTRSPVSRASSRSSSKSLDELLLEAAADDRAQQAGLAPPGTVIDPNAPPIQRSPRQHRQHGHHHSQHPSRHRTPQRSPSPGAYPPNFQPPPGYPQRPRAQSSLNMPPQMVGPGMGSPGSMQGHGPLQQPGQMQTFNTHTFATPITGAPVKKSKGPALNGSGSVMTLGA